MVSEDKVQICTLNLWWHESAFSFLMQLTFTNAKAVVFNVKWALSSKSGYQAKQNLRYVTQACEKARLTQLQCGSMFVYLRAWQKQLIDCPEMFPGTAVIQERRSHWQSDVPPLPV